jgi:hypothetical protein
MAIIYQDTRIDTKARAEWRAQSAKNLGAIVEEVYDLATKPKFFDQMERLADIFINARKRQLKLRHKNKIKEFPHDVEYK